MTRAIYPGSFDPITNGHLDIIERSSKMVDELVVGVLNNSAKNSLFSVEERVSMLKEMTREMPNVTVASFDGLLVDFMEQIDATIIIRGLRAISDYEYLSSTIVKEFASYGGDISQFVPKQLIDKIYAKYHITK